MQDPRLSEPLASVIEDEPGGFDIRAVWHTIAKHKWAIGGLTILVTLIAALFVYRQTPIYRATATLLIERSPVQFSPVQDPYAAFTDHWLYYQTQYGLIKRRAIGERVVDKLGLDRPRAAEPAKPTGFSWKQLLPEEWFPPPATPTPQQRYEGAVGWVVGGIGVNPRRDSQLVDVSFVSADPREAANLANAVAEAYIEDNLKGREEMTTAATDYLTDRLVELKEKWESSEQLVQNYLDQQELIDVEGVDSFANRQLTLATEKLGAAQRARVEAQIRLDRVQESRIQGDPLSLLPVVGGEGLVQTANAAHQSALRKVEELSERYGPKHPKMISARSELTSAESALGRQIDVAVNTLHRDYQTALAAEESAEREIDTVKTQLRDIDRKEFRLEALRREADKNREVYEQFLTQFKSTSASGDLRTANARIVEYARAPGTPFKPNKRRALSIAFLLGLMASIGLAFLLEHLDNTLKDAEDVERRLGIPVLGVLPRLKTVGGTDLSPLRSFSEDQKTVFAEAIRTVRTGVLLSALDEKRRVLVVTSSVPGEGKTTLSMNLARAIGEMKKVLLIDADMRRPTVARALGQQTDVKGLSQFISGEAPLKDCIHRLDDCDNLRMMPAGVVPPNPLEMLSSQKFSHALDQFAERFDYVVIDCAPALAVSDAMVLSKLATSVIYLIRADSTPVQAAQSGMKRLQRVGAHVIGAVINYVQHRTGRYYGKYSHYGSGYYSSYGYMEQRR